MVWTNEVYIWVWYILLGKFHSIVIMYEEKWEMRVVQRKKRI